ncbi:MAG TPA: SCO family protein [Acetobacteraceae bacterium]|nr:SCO family protein [Acetobacteraceae bacterium]
MRLNLGGLSLAAALIAATPAWAAAPVPASPAAAALGGPFTLVDQDGQVVTDLTFRGKWLLIYFGYTHCPDLCPMTLGTIAGGLEEIEPAKRDKVRVLFISVDPARDTPQVMKDYVSAFPDANVVGLTGTQEQVSAASSAYHVRAKRRPAADGDYSMTHPSVLFLTDPEGRFVAVVPPENVGRHLARLVQ